MRKENLDKFLSFQLAILGQGNKHSVKIVKVAEPWQWYNNDRIVCKIWNCPCFDGTERTATYSRIMFVSASEKVMYRDFFGKLDEAWDKANEIYDNIPDVVNNKWLEENGFEEF